MEKINSALASLVASWVNHVAAEVTAEKRNMMGGIMRDLGAVDLEVIIAVKAGIIRATCGQRGN